MKPTTLVYASLLGTGLASIIPSSDTPATLLPRIFGGLNPQTVSDLGSQPATCPPVRYYDKCRTYYGNSRRLLTKQYEKIDALGKFIDKTNKANTADDAIQQAGTALKLSLGRFGENEKPIRVFHRLIPYKMKTVDLQTEQRVVAANIQEVQTNYDKYAALLGPETEKAFKSIFSFVEFKTILARYYEITNKLYGTQNVCKGFLKSTPWCQW